MRKYLIAILRYLIPLGLAGLLLYFAFRNIEFKEFIGKLDELNYSWVIYSIVLSIGVYAARGYRWTLLLAPAGHKVNTYRTTLAVFIGYLANVAFPRLGEVTRCAALKKSNNIPIPTSLGTVIVERIVDSLCLLILIGVSFAIEYELVLKFIQEISTSYDIDFSKFIKLGILLTVITSIVLIVVIKAGENKLARKIKEILQEVMIGVMTIRKLKNPTGFILSTLALWAGYYLMSYIIVFSLDETSFLDVQAGFMLLVVGGVAVALPVQGGIGTYHAMVGYMLFLYGIELTTGIFLATVLHTSQLITVLLFGGVSFLLAMLLPKQPDHEQEQDQG
ncbi:MAG: flippase-like domain-containing protein [Cyclobacteriaceae bacterium]